MEDESDAAHNRTLAGCNARPGKLVILPKKKEFKPFTLIEGHEVRETATAGQVRIGCKTFQMKVLVGALRAVVRDEQNKYGDFRASKSGLRHDMDVISWESADVLLKNLEVYLEEGVR